MCSERAIHIEATEMHPANEEEDSPYSGEIDGIIDNELLWAEKPEDDTIAPDSIPFAEQYHSEHADQYRKLIDDALHYIEQKCTANNQDGRLYQGESSRIDRQIKQDDRSVAKFASQLERALFELNKVTEKDSKKKGYYISLAQLSKDEIKQAVALAGQLKVIEQMPWKNEEGNRSKKLGYRQATRQDGSTVNVPMHFFSKNKQRLIHQKIPLRPDARIQDVLQVIIQGPEKNSNK